MEYDQIPKGFVSALIRNEQAVNAYAMMTKEQKEEVLAKARACQSAHGLNRLLSEIASEAAF